MNNQLLAKIIKYNSKSCPELIYDNPLLNRNIANELSRSFVKILTSCKQNSQTSNNLRYCILENIRKLCTFQPEGHIKLIENAFDALIALYNEGIPRTINTIHSCQQKLDEFLLRNLNDCEIASEFNTTHRPELIQALFNLNSSNDTSPDIIHWNLSNQKWNTILKNVWNNSDNCSELVLDDASIKMKPEIEKLILEELYQFINCKNYDVGDYLESNKVFIDLANKCSKSKECFRICIRIFNHLFVASNFNPKLEIFLPVFIKYIKSNVAEEKFPLLYPENLQCLAILMNISSEILLNHDFMLKDETLRQLNSLEMCHKPDVVMLLSHYPEWIEIYLEFKSSNT